MICTGGICRAFVDPGKDLDLVMANIYMLPIITNDLYKKEFLYEASMILTEDGKNVSRKSSK